MIACGLQLTWSPSTPFPFRSIAIEGPIGVGKTALAERARDAPRRARRSSRNARTRSSPTSTPGAPARRCSRSCSTCSTATASRLSLRQANLFAQTTICDYLFDKDKIFAYLNLDDNELFIYQRLYDLLAADVPAPDLVIYLQAPTEVLERAAAPRPHARPERRAPGARSRHPTTSRS